MSIQDEYKAMMEEIHAPAKLLEKTKGVSVNKTKYARRFFLRYATVSMAALLGVFVVTNGVCYAATGETWVEKATVWVNGTPVDVDVYTYQDGEVYTRELTYNVGDDEAAGMSLSVITEGDDNLSSDDMEIEITDYTKPGAPKGNWSADGMILESQDGKVLLNPADGVDPIDLTEELKSHGVASGTYTQNGETYVYKVSGAPGDYHASVEKQ